MDFGKEEIRRRLTAGESLEVSTGGGVYEVWAEPYANPASVFYEGRAFLYSELEEVIDMILGSIAAGGVQCRWVEPRGIQTKACQEAHRLRVAADPD